MNGFTLSLGFSLLFFYCPTKSAIFGIYLNGIDGKITQFASINNPTINFSFTSQQVNTTTGVTCGLLNSTWSTQISNGVFSVYTLQPAETNGTIMFTCTVPGKERQFRCYFMDDPSQIQSPIYSIKCNIGPVINLCPSAIKVSSTSRTRTQVLSIRFSESVDLSPVMVECNSSNIASVSFAQNALSVPIGRQNYQTTVTLNSLADPATLRCQATSTVGSQYMPNSSVGANTEISATNLSIEIFPSGGIVTSNSFLITLNSNFKFAGIFLKCEAILSQSTSNVSANAGTYCMSNLTQSKTGVYWLVTPSLIQLQSSFFQLNVSRSVYPSWNDTGQTENVTVVCCNQATTGVAPGLSATATFTIRLHDMWLHSSSAATETTEVTLPNPAFTNIAPCPCDLTKHLCDAGCCCDQDCSEYQPMPCLSGPQGGEPPSLDPSSCWIKTVAAVSTLSYYPALCIFFNNTAVLGLYYDQVSFISSAQDFYSKADSSTSNLRVEPSTIDQGSRGYSQVSGSALTLGSPIRLCLVQYDMLSGDLGTDPSCQLAAQPLQLPAASFSSRLNTVKYLEDFNTDGGLSPILMTSEVCSNAGNVNLIPGQGPTASLTDGSRLNPRSYLLSNPATDRICPPFFRVVANQTSTITTLPIIVNYFCLSQSEMIASGYLQNPNRVISLPLNLTLSVSIFSNLDLSIGQEENNG
uniref:Tectonic-1-3 N-terminal domain-containing protein n=1 Tax=Schistocephalus solidus TaxID=70667 RepID=A0A0X3NV79_SCHSO